MLQTYVADYGVLLLLLLITVVASLLALRTWLKYKTRLRKLPKDYEEAEKRIQSVKDRLKDTPTIESHYFKVMFLGPRKCGKTWIWRTWSEPWLARPKDRNELGDYPRATISALNTWEMFNDANSISTGTSRTREKLAMERYVKDPIFEIERPFGLQINAELYDSVGEIGEAEGQILKQRLDDHVKNSQRLSMHGMNRLVAQGQRRQTESDKVPVFLLFFFDFLGNVNDEADGISTDSRRLFNYPPSEGLDINKKYYSLEFCQTLRAALKRSDQHVIIGAELVFSQSDRMDPSLRSGNAEALRDANREAINNIESTFGIRSARHRLVSAMTNEGVNYLLMDVLSRGITDGLRTFRIGRETKEGQANKFEAPEMIVVAGNRTNIAQSSDEYTFDKEN